MKAASASNSLRGRVKKSENQAFPQLVANRPSMSDLSDSSVQNIHSTTQCGIYKIKKIVKILFLSHHHLEFRANPKQNCTKKNEAIRNTYMRN